MKEAPEVIKQKLSRFYDQEAQGYHKIHYRTKVLYSPLAQRQKYIENMVEEVRTPRGAKVLDVGCGPGELVLSLLRKGYDALGVDISPGMVEEASRTIQESGFPQFSGVSVGDIEKLNFSDGEFDIVIASGVIEYQKDDRDALIEMRRITKRGGYLIINVSNRYSPITISENLYWSVSNIPFVRNAASFIKRQILGTGELTNIPVRRTHSPRQFDRTLARLGFQKVSHNFFRYSLLPVPLDSIFAVSRQFGLRMERFSRGPIGPLGGGYIVMAKKSDPVT